MDKSVIENVFSGFIKDEQLFNTICEYVNLVSNNKKNETNFKCNLLVCVNDENKGIIFASKLAKIFKKSDLAKSFSCVGSDEDILYLDDVTVVDDFVSSKAILDKINDAKGIVFFVTSKDKLVEYKKDSDVYYKTFYKEVFIKEYSIEDVIGGCHFLLDKNRKSEKIDFDDTLFDKLDKYIRIVYPRAILKDEAFVLDLIDRLIFNSFKSDTPNLITDACIPYYHEQGLYEDCKNDLVNSFIFSSEIAKVLSLVNDNKKIKDLKLDSVKPNFNMHITSFEYNDALLFARLYASLLYSKEMEIISSKQVKEVNEEELDKLNLNDVHGVILVNKVTDESKLAKLIDDSKDIVWLVYGDTKFEHELKYLFNSVYNLDNHDLDSSRKYVELFYKSKGLEANDVDDLVLKVNEASDVYKAKTIIEKYVASNITGELLKQEEIVEVKPVQEIKETKEVEVVEDSSLKEFDEVLKKEKELGEAFKKIKKTSDERNVLLLAMSVFPFNLSIGSYVYKDNIKGKYVSQMESTTKALAESLGKENKYIDCIYVLNTEKTIGDFKKTKYNSEKIEKNYTAFEYYKERCNGFVGEIKDTTLMNQKTGVAVYEFVKEITKDNKKVNLYIDIHGGPRDTFAAVNAVMMLVKEIDNIELKDIISVRYANKENATEVLSALKEYDVFDFVSGMREFLSFGRSNGLVEFNKKNKDANEELVKVINGISDSIVLSQMDDFEERLKAMNTTLNKTSDENGYYDTVKSLMKRNYVVNYGEEDINLLENTDDLLAQIKWCLDKSLLTQALVLVETNSAKYMHKHGLLEFVKQKNSNYNVDKFLNDIAINSICNPESLVYLASGRGDDKEMVDVSIGYFKCYVKDFNGIRANSFDEALNKIKNLEKGLTLKQAQKFYEIYDGNISDGNEYYCTTYKEKITTRYNCQARVLPVKETRLLNREDFVEDYYICLYLFKSLKSFRNAVAHALDYKKREKYSAKEIKFWVQLYMEQLNKLVHYDKNYLNKPKVVEKKTEVVNEKKEFDDPNAEANEDYLNKLMERYKK